MEETMAELGMIEKAKEKIRRNIRTIGEALESK